MKPSRPPPAITDDELPVEALRLDPDAFSVEQGGRYLHWDELRYRPARPRLSHEDWWRLIKLARRHVRRALPLADERRVPFTFVMTDTIQRLVHEIDRDASGRIELPEDVTNQATRDRYVVNSLIEEAFRSSQLEGASTTRQVATDMIRSKRPPRTLSERMILNNFHAMEWVRDHRDDALSEAALLELHAIVTRDTLDVPDGGGRFRRVDEDIAVVDPADGEVVHRPPDARALPARMASLCEFANQSTSGEPFIHPVVRAILLHLWLAYDHPFVDGNGRAARALFYWSMLRQGYWLTEFISISRVIRQQRTQYDDAFLYTERDDNDTTYFLLNQLKVLRLAIDELGGYLQKKAREVREVERGLRGRAALNGRQLAVLSYLVRHPDARISIEGHQTSHRVAYQTARTDLLGLVAGGFLDQAKQGKKLWFTPVRELHRKLAPTR
ncbi:MAG: Fic family protein [Kofleriaceae bacterium]